MVSSGGGTQPRWRRDGKELFYVSGDRTVMAVDVTSGPTFKAGIPKALFDAEIASASVIGRGTPAFRWDVTDNGERFLINTVPKETGTTSINVVLNWQEELKQRVPTR